MRDNTCFICCEPLSKSEATGIDCLLESLTEILQVSYCSFTGDLLLNTDLEEFDRNCYFCNQCEDLIATAVDLRKRLSVLKRKLIDTLAIGHQKRRKHGPDVGISEATRLVSKVAYRFGECFTKSTVVISAEDGIPLERLKALQPTTSVKQESDEEDVVFLNEGHESDDTESDEFEPEELPSPPPRKKRPRLRVDDSDDDGQVEKREKAVRSSGRRKSARTSKATFNEEATVIDLTDTEAASEGPRAIRRSSRKRKVPEADSTCVDEIEVDWKPENEHAGEEEVEVDWEPENEHGQDTDEDNVGDTGITHGRRLRPRKKKKPTEDTGHCSDTENESSNNSRYICGDCETTWSSIKLLDKHITMKHKERVVDRPYGCPVCLAMFATVDDLKKHVVYHQITKGQTSTCLLCSSNEPLSDLAFLTGHYSKEHGLDFLSCKYFGCIRCLQAFKSTEESTRNGLVGADDLPTFKLFAEEHRSCTPPNEGSVSQFCRFCPEKRSTAVELISHENTHFTDLYYCKVCDFEFRSEPEWKVHDACHRKIKNIARPIEPRLPNQKVRPRNFRCDICGRRFGLLSALRKHLKGHADSEKTDQEVPLSYGEAAELHCPFCEFSTLITVSLSAHVNSIHNITQFSKFDTYFYNCSLCLTVFQPSDPTELPGVLRYEDMESLKKFASEHARCSKQLTTEFQCPKCEDEFNHPKELFDHMVSQHKQELKKYYCDRCPSVFESNTDYLHHLRQEHLDQLELKCQCYRCGRQFEDVETLQAHILESFKQLQCPGCDQNFKGLESYQKHKCNLDQVPGPKEVISTEVPSHCTQLNGGFPCFQCKKTFDSVALLSLHFQEHHDKAKEINFNCSICSATLTSSETALKNSENTFYSTKDDFEHANFTSLCIQHWKTCISNPEKSACFDLPEPSFECYDCRQTQASPQALAVHLNEHHGASEVQQCPACTLYFTNDKNLNEHLSNYHNVKHWMLERYYCRECWIPFSLDDAQFEQDGMTQKYWPQFHAFLEQHFLCKADRVTPKCKYCSHEPDTMSNRFDHEVRTHTKNFKQYCEQCGKGFLSLRELKYHMRAHEGQSRLGERSTCHVCSKSFVKKSALKEHLAVHEEGPPPYVCQHCGKGFYIRSCLVIHENFHVNPRPKEPTVPCPVCGKLFVTVEYQKHHVKYVHNKYPRRPKKRKTGVQQPQVDLVEDNV